MKLTDICLGGYEYYRKLREYQFNVNDNDRTEDIEISEDELDKLMEEMATVFHNFVAEKKQQIGNRNKTLVGTDTLVVKGNWSEEPEQEEEFKVGDRVIARDLDIPGHYSGTIVKRGGEIYYISLDIDRLAKPCKVHASQLDKIFAEVGSDDDIEEPEQEEFKVGDRVKIEGMFALYRGQVISIVGDRHIAVKMDNGDTEIMYIPHCTKISDCLVEETIEPVSTTALSDDLVFCKPDGDQTPLTDEDLENLRERLQELDQDDSHFIMGEPIKLTEEELKLREMFPSHYKD
jgi:transcription antitermination factor NusG